jgi:hypothetical protein
MPQLSDRPLFICPTCEVPTGPRPTFHLGLAFCCAGCAADGPCRCSYDQEEIDDQLDATLDDRVVVATDTRIGIAVTADDRVGMVGAAR